MTPNLIAAVSAFSDPTGVVRVSRRAGTRLVCGNNNASNRVVTGSGDRCSSVVQAE